MENQEILNLVNKAKNNDSSALAELYDIYFPMIYSFVYYRVNHKETAEDLTSLIFTKVIEKIHKFDTEKAYFKAWIYTIARNTVIDHYRSSKKTLDIDLFNLEDKSEDMNNVIDNKELLLKIQKNLSQLSPSQREIITMRIWDQLSYKEIAEALNKSEASCKMAFSRAIKTLRTGMAIMLIFVTTIIIKHYG